MKGKTVSPYLPIITLNINGSNYSIIRCLGLPSKESTCSVGYLVQSLGLEDLLEEGMATHSSILAWRVPMDRGAWWATAHGVTKNQT